MKKEDFDLRDITKIDYSSLCLVSNPFPSIAIPDLLPSVTADRKEILENFKDNLRQTIFENRSAIMILSGHWGTGKSHLLKFFKYKVNSQLLNSENRAISVYLKSLGKSFLDFYLNFVDDVGRDFLTSVSNQIILNFFEEKGDSYLKKSLMPNVESVSVKSSSIEEILMKSKFYDIFLDIKTKYQQISSDVVYAVLLMKVRLRYC
ncbi:MAG: P-loop NTPase fold protein [Nitrosotalea sp.]